MATTAQLVSRYGRKFNTHYLTGSAVTSPLGVWLLLALVAPSVVGDQREQLEAVLGTDADDAAVRAAALLANPHPAVAAAVAVWAREMFLNEEWQVWAAGLPGSVERGEIPAQPVADAWAAARTMGMIERFPIVLRPDTALVLASALATDVTWCEPFDFVDSSLLGGAFAKATARALSSATGHDCFLAQTQAAGVVAIHVADATDGLRVVSVIGEEGLAPSAVNDAASQVAELLAAESREDARRDDVRLDDEALDRGSLGGDAATAHRLSLYDVPLGPGPAWIVTESLEPVSSAEERPEHTDALLVEWSVRSEHNIGGAPGMSEAFSSLATMLRPERRPAVFEAKQSAFASYTRTGFKAAAVTAIAMRVGAFLQPSTAMVRRATIRFNRPYAVIALAMNTAPDPELRVGMRELGVPEWTSVPVFTAWVARPVPAADVAVELA